MIFFLFPASYNWRWPVPLIFTEPLLKLLRKVVLVFWNTSFSKKQESKKGTDEGWIPENSMTLPHCFCLCSFLCAVFILRINVFFSVYFYLDWKYTRTLTPKWIVFIFINFWKLGEGGKMDKVLVMLAAGNAAQKVNSIKKKWALVFFLKRVATTIFFFFIRQLYSWETWCSDISWRVIKYLFNFSAMLSFCFQLRTTGGGQHH